MKTAAVIVASDKCYIGKRRDESGLYLKDELTKLGFEVKDYVIVADETEQIYDAIEKEIRAGISLVITTGGTGFSKRDVTPEATKAAIERETPGICEAIRQKSMEITPRAMLSRAVAGISGDTLIINFPGSKKACGEALEIIMPALGHGLDILSGGASECARD